MNVGRRVSWGWRQATAAAVMLIALSTSLLMLAKPTGRAAADPAIPTDITASIAVSCNPDGSADQVQVTLTGFNTAPTQGPTAVELQLVPTGQLTLSAALGTGINVPTYMTVSPPFTTIWLNGTVALGQADSVLIQAAGYGPSAPITVPATCDQTLSPPIEPSDLGLAALPGASVTSAVCNTAADGSSDGTAMLTVSVTDPNDSANFAVYNQFSGMGEIDYGVFATDAAGNILAPTGLALAQFDSAGTALDTPTLVLPAAGQTDDQLWVVGTDGQASSTGAALGTLPGCPVNGPTTAPVVVPPPPATDSTTADPATSSPANQTSSTDSDSTTQSSSPPPPSESQTPAQPTTSEAVTSSAPAPAPATTSEPVAPATTFTEGVTATSALVVSPLPKTSASNATPIGIPSVSGLLDSPSSFAADALPIEVSPTPTLSLSGGGKLSTPVTGPLAGAESTIKPVQILRWHQDAALVVGFDALAIFSLVGATVWSARRR